MIDESAEPPEAEEPAADTPEAEASTPAPAEEPAAAAEPELEEDVVADDEDEEPAPRVKPAIPGADLEVDIVAEGADPLAREEMDEYELAEAMAADEDRQDEQPVAAVIDLASGARYRATGKRKTAVARVILKPGTGAYTVNGKPLDTFFPRPSLGRNIRQPLEAVGYEDRMDVIVRVHGGGVSSQAGALRHGIARALASLDPENNRPTLKKAGFLTRDPRVIERKKAGLKKARKAPQYSKR